MPTPPFRQTSKSCGVERRDNDSGLLAITGSEHCIIRKVDICVRGVVPSTLSVLPHKTLRLEHHVSVHSIRLL